MLGFVLTEERKKKILTYANYMVQTYATYKATAKAFGITKSQLYNDINRHLPKINPNLYEKIKKISAENTADCVNRMAQLHKNEGDKRLHDIENYFISILKENDVFTFRLDDIKEEFNLSLAGMYSVIMRLADNPDSSIILIDRNKSKGEYTVAVKTEKYIKMKEQSSPKKSENKKITKKKTKKKTVNKKQTVTKEKKQVIPKVKEVAKEEISEEVLEGQIKWEV